MNEDSHQQDHAAEVTGISYHRGRVKTDDQLDLVWQSWIPAAPAGVIVIIHGLAEHSGRYQETAEAFAGLEAALVHADIGTGYPDRDAVTLRWLPDLVARLLAQGGIAVSGLPLEDARLTALPLPPGIAPDRYFLYRRETSE